MKSIFLTEKESRTDRRGKEEGKKRRKMCKMRQMQQHNTLKKRYNVNQRENESAEKQTLPQRSACRMRGERQQIL